MSEPERSSGIWNPESLFSGETPSPSPSPPPPPPPPEAAPSAAASPAPAEATDPFYAPPPPSYPSQPSYPPPSPAYPPPAPAPASGGGVRKPVVWGLAAAAVVAILAVVAVFAVIGNRGEPAAETVSYVDSPTAVPAEAPTTVDTPSPVTPSPEPRPSTESTPDALAQLQTLSAEGLAQVTFDGQYAAQIASKYPGIPDPLQTTAAGSHTFGAADILAEYLSLRDAHGSAEHPVILLKSTDYGKRQMVGTHFLWVTFAIGAFPDKQSVHDWCDAQFADLTEQQRANQCGVRRLEPGR
jgi:hypothetical protein